MPFESGSTSFRMLELPRAFPENFAEKFAAHRAGPLDAVGAGDAFATGVLLSAYRGWSLEKAIGIGGAVAAVLAFSETSVLSRTYAMKTGDPVL